jgi:hypothetical protein
MKIDHSAYQSLEITKILDIIARGCRCDLGVRRLASAEPAPDMDELSRRHELFGAVERYRDVRGDLPWSSRLSAVGHYLEEAKTSGMLSG